MKNYFLKNCIIFFRRNPLDIIDNIQRVQQSNLQECDVCGGVHIQLAFDSKKIDDLQELILKAIYNDSISEEQTIAELALYYGDTLWSGVVEGTKKQNLADSYQANLQEWLNRQHNNIYKFATAKSYAELLEYRNQIIDPQTGEMRSFDDFRKYCDGIKAKYRQNWLEAEYNAVVNGTIQGVNWLQFQENKDLFPYLKYVAINDNRTREAHRMLNGIIEPIDSTFWTQYYPPNGWNCRCLTTQLTKKQAEHQGYESDSTDVNMKRAGAVVKDKYWRKNTGTGSIFDENNTVYFQAMPSEGKKQLSALKNYGLKNSAEILKNSNLPKATIGKKEDFEKHWDIFSNKDGIIRAKCKLGFEYEFNDNFKKHIQDSKHEVDFPNLLDIIKKPDEVWEGELPSQTYGTKWFRKYLKYYEGKPYVVLIDNTGIPKTMYAIENNSSWEKYRMGILNYKK